MCAVRSAQRNRLSISSQQLHSSVRTGNLETCLRLLSLGAQANFFHPVSDKEKAFSLFACTQLEVLLNIVLWLFSWPTGERKHSTTHSSQSRTGVPGRAAGGLRRRPRGPGLQRKDPHRLRKVTLNMCNFSSFFLYILFHLVFI